jgi:hypothetical protein
VTNLLVTSRDDAPNVVELRALRQDESAVDRFAGPVAANVPVASL